MRVMRAVKRILIAPAFVLIMAAHLIVELALKLSAWFFYLFGFICLVTTVLCYYMQLESAHELHRMLICSGVLFLIPQIATMLSAVLEVAVEIMGGKLRGGV